mgnify:FL=1
MKFKIPNNKTSLCISLAAIPGNSGSLLHNSAYKLTGLNYIYIPIKCSNHHEAYKILKNLNFKGCSLSMPLKQKLINKIDYLDIISKKTKSVNTVLKKKNKLYGFNTDYYSLNKIIKNKKLNKTKTKILILGNGGVAQTSYHVVKDLKFNNIYLSSRNPKRYKDWKLGKNCKTIEWKNRNKIKVNILINATPIGMSNATKEKTPVSISFIKKLNTIIDFTINKKKNTLEKNSKKLKKEYLSGKILSFYQGAKQFSIYTNKKVNEKKLIKILKYKIN